MTIKISGRNEELFEANLKTALNIGQVASQRGYIPDEHYSNPNYGRVWIEDPNGYDLAPISNDYKAFVRNRGENFIELEFSYRYDGADRPFANALTVLVAAVLRQDAEIFE